MTLIQLKLNYIWIRIIKHEDSYIVPLVDNIFEFFCNVIFHGADRTIRELKSDLAFDVANHPHPGVETNGDIDGEVFERDQIFAVHSENDLKLN